MTDLMNLKSPPCYPLTQMKVEAKHRYNEIARHFKYDIGILKKAAERLAWMNEYGDAVSVLDRLLELKPTRKVQLLREKCMYWSSV